MPPPPSKRSSRSSRNSSSVSPRSLVVGGIVGGGGVVTDVDGGMVGGAVVAGAVVVGGGVVVAGRLVVRSQRAPSTASGAGLFAGRVVTVSTATGSRGQAFVEGAWWTVRTTGAPLAPGTLVRVVDVDGLDLVVEPVGRQGDDDQEVQDDG